MRFAFRRRFPRVWEIWSGDPGGTRNEVMLCSPGIQHSRRSQLSCEGSLTTEKQLLEKKLSETVLLL